MSIRNYINDVDKSNTSLNIRCNDFRSDGDAIIDGNLTVNGDIIGLVEPGDIDPGVSTNALLNVDNVGAVGFGVTYRNEVINYNVNYVNDGLVLAETGKAERIGDTVHLTIDTFVHTVIVPGGNFFISGLPSWVLPTNDANAIAFQIPFENGVALTTATGYVGSTLLILNELPVSLAGSGGLNVTPGGFGSSITLTYQIK